jgi:hypothetical protein
VFYFSYEVWRGDPGFPLAEKFLKPSFLGKEKMAFSSPFVLRMD